MTNKIKELDVEFIGGQEPITKEEELAISAFIQANKKKKRMQDSPKTKTKTFKKAYQPA